VIERKEIEQIRDIDVDLIADRNECREAEPLRRVWCFRAQ
jgi:hypothetical protein